MAKTVADMTPQELIKMLVESLGTYFEARMQTHDITIKKIKAEGTRVIEELTEVITGVTQVASEKNAESEKRIDRLEEHTGLAKHN